MGGQPPKKPMRKSSIAIIFEIIALIALVVAFYQIAKDSFSAKKTGEKFFVAMMNGEWDAAYGMMDLEENEFINEEQFLAAVERSPDAFGVSVENYVAREERKNDQETEVIVNFRRKGAESDDEGTITLKKQSQKNLLLFDSWKVSGQQFAQKFSVAVPAGAEVVFDGIKLDRKYIRKPGGDQETYELPAVFSAYHEIAVSMEGRKEVKARVHASQKEYSLQSLPYQEEELSGLIETAGQNMEAIYAAALDGKNFSEIKQFFTTDSNALNQIQRDYSSLVDAVKARTTSSSTKNPYQYEFRGIQGTAYGEAYQGQSSAVTVYLEYQYTMSYVYRGTEGADSSRKNSMSFHYVMEDGKWVLLNLGCIALN